MNCSSWDKTLLSQKQSQHGCFSHCAWSPCVWWREQLSLTNFSQGSWVEPYHQPNQNNFFFKPSAMTVNSVKSVLCSLSDVLQSTPKSHEVRKNRGWVSWLSWIAVLIFIPKFGNEVTPKQMVIDARGFLTRWAAATYRLTVRQPFHCSELGLMPPLFPPPVISSDKTLVSLYLLSFLCSAPWGHLITFGKYALVFALETLGCLSLAPFSFVRHAVFFPGKDIGLHSPLHFQAWAHTLHKLTLYL